MARKRTPHPTDGELEILDVLWKHGPAGLGPIREELNEHRDVAPTTVATMLGVMRDKKLVRRRKTRRGYEWSAAVTHEEAARGLVSHVLDRVFDGSASRLVTHLVDAGNLSAAELRELKAALDRNGNAPAKRRK